MSVKTKIKMENFKQLDGTTKSQVSEVGEGILRRFARTDFPVKPEDIVCAHFFMLAWANGCPYNCAWCFLKGTFRFKPQEEDGRVAMVFKDRERLAKALSAFLADKSLPAEIINTGELSDSLMQEGNSEKATFSEFIMSYVAGSKHKVLFLTKSTNIQKFLVNKWQKNAILGWSLNASEVSSRWEKLSPIPSERIAAAKIVFDAGYEVRLRIDPMVHVDNWKYAYGSLVDEIFSKLKPSVITLGCLRGLSTTVIHAKDKSWVPYLTEKSNWGRKPSHKERLEMYEYIIAKIREYDKTVQIALCKETLIMYASLGMKPSEIRCNCTY